MKTNKQIIESDKRQVFLLERIIEDIQKDIDKTELYSEDFDSFTEKKVMMEDLKERISKEINELSDLSPNEEYRSDLISKVSSKLGISDLYLDEYSNYDLRSML